MGFGVVFNDNFGFCVLTFIRVFPEDKGPQVHLPEITNNELDDNLFWV